LIRRVRIGTLSARLKRSTAMDKVQTKEDIFEALRAHRAQLDELRVVSLSLF